MQGPKWVECQRCGLVDFTMRNGHVGTAKGMKCPDCADEKGEARLCRYCCPSGHQTHKEEVAEMTPAAVVFECVNDWIANAICSPSASKEFVLLQPVKVPGVLGPAVRVNKPHNVGEEILVDQLRWYIRGWNVAWHFISHRVYSVMEDCDVPPQLKVDLDRVLSGEVKESKMRAPFLESRRHVQIGLEVSEQGDQARVIARRTTDNFDDVGLDETFVLTSLTDVKEFRDWLIKWCVGDETERAFRLGREIDMGQAKLSGKRSVRVQL